MCLDPGLSQRATIRGVTSHSGPCDVTNPFVYNRSFGAYVCRLIVKCSSKLALGVI